PPAALAHRSRTRNLADDDLSASRSMTTGSSMRWVPITKLFINALAGDVASRRELERVIEGNEKTGPKGLVLDAGVGAFMTHLHWLEIVDMECPIPSKPAERPKDTQ
ncbi:MAG: hypothetical protein AAFX94_25435, partial [Myxococcota bacterium]